MNKNRVREPKPDGYVKKPRKKSNLNYFEQQDLRVDRVEKKRLKLAKEATYSNVNKLRIYASKGNRETLKLFAYQLYHDSLEGSYLEKYLIKRCQQNAFRYDWDAAKHSSKLKTIKLTIRFLKHLSDEHLQYLKRSNQYRIEF